MAKGFARALAWSALGAWAAQAVSTLAFLALSRIVGPTVYGLVGLLAIGLTVSQAVLTEGFGQAALRGREADPELLDVLFRIQLGLGLLFALLFAVAGGPLARRYNAAALAPLAAAAGFIPLLQALGSVQYELIRRDFRFERVAARTFGGAAAGAAAGVGVAIAGGGPWALVSMQAIQAGVQSAVLWRSTPWRPRPRLQPGWRARQAADLRWGASALFGCLLNLADTQMPRLAMATYFGVLPLAYYNLGTRLAEVLMLASLLPVRQLAAPMFAARAQDRTALADALVMMVKTAALGAAPALIGLYLVAPEALALVFGTAWTPALPYVRAVLALFLAVPVTMIGGDLVTVAGRLSTRRWIHGLSLVTGTAVLLASAKLGPVATAWLFSLRAIALAPVLLFAAARIAGARAAPFLRLTLALAAPCAALTGAVLASREALGAAPPALRLAAETGAGALAYAGLSLVLFRGEAAALAGRFRRRPAPA